MKKIAKSLLVFVCLIASQMAWAESVVQSEMNIYATKLTTTGEVTREGRVATLSFGLNASASESSATIYIDTNRDGDYADEHPISYTHVSGNYVKNETTTLTCTIPENLAGGEYNWAIKVSGSGTHNTGTAPLVARAYDNKDYRYYFQYPKAIAINTNYDSRYCGYSFVGEAGTLTTPRPTSQGIYVFGPSLGQYGNYTGNITWITHSGDKFGPYRICIDRDDYLYVCESRPYTETEDKVWRVNSSDFIAGTNSTFASVLTKTILTNNRLPERVFAITAGEEGNNKMLYIISGTLISGNINSAKLSAWLITETSEQCTLTLQRSLDLTDIAYTTKEGNPKNQKLVSLHCSIVPGNENGDLWIFQQETSSTTDDEKFAALHLDLNSTNNTWEADYRIPASEQCNTSGTGAISRHYAKDNASDHYLAIPTRETKGNTGKYVVKVFRISDDPAHPGKPKRTECYCIYDPTESNSTNIVGFGKAGLEAMAFDAANNLYFTTNKNYRLFVYSLPKDNEHTTPCNTAAKLNVPYAVTWNSQETGYTTNRELTPYLYSSDWLPTLSKEGYIFHGWYDEAGNKVTQITRNITLTAKWTELIIDEKTTDNTPVISIANEFANGTLVNIKVNRKLQGGMFSSFCLPFDLDATTLTNATSVDGSKALLAGASIWTFNDVQTEEDGTKILQFTQTQTVPAYTPFLIKPVNDVAETIYFKNIIINYQAAGTVTHDGITFTGVINPVELAAGSNIFFLVSDNRLAIPAAGGATLGGLRGYFTNPSGARLAIRTQQNTPTLLESVNCNIKNTYKILQDGKIYIIRDGVMYDIKGYRL